MGAFVCENFGVPVWCSGFVDRFGAPVWCSGLVSGLVFRFGGTGAVSPGLMKVADSTLGHASIKGNAIRRSDKTITLQRKVSWG